MRNLFRFAREVCVNPLGHHRAVRNASLFAGVLAVLSMTIPWWVVLVVLAVLMALSVVQLALMDRGCMPHRYLCGSDGALPCKDRCVVHDHIARPGGTVRRWRSERNRQVVPVLRVLECHLAAALSGRGVTVAIVIVVVVVVAV